MVAVPTLGVVLLLSFSFVLCSYGLFPCTGESRKTATLMFFDVVWCTRAFISTEWRFGEGIMGKTLLAGG
jgi:hypothetical protein